MTLNKIIQVLTTYDVVILPALFVSVWIFGFINWSKNVYRKQNKQLEICRVNVLRNPRFTGVYIANIPEEYRRQWRAFVNSNAQRPSLVFEFVPKRNKICAAPLFVISALASCVYLALFFVNFSHKDYVVFQAAFWLAFVVVVMVDHIMFAKKEKRAKQVFGQFVQQLNSAKLDKRCTSPQTTAQKLDTLKKQTIGDQTIEQASQILHENGLEDATRTVEEQKDINTALNGLLQAYSNLSSKPLRE